MQLVGKGDGVEDVSVIHAPFSLWPTPFPRLSCEHVQQSMPLFSYLVDQLSQDTEYLQRTLRPAAQHDSFTAKLLSILSESQGGSKRSGLDIALGLHRSDYMLDEPTGTLLQVQAATFVLFALLSAHSKMGEKSKLVLLALQQMLPVVKQTETGRTSISTLD